MNKQIRFGLETNSSSSHSLSIGNKETRENLDKFRNTVIEISSAYYGSGPEVITTFKDKLTYLCQYCLIDNGLLEHIESVLLSELNSSLSLVLSEDYFAEENDLSFEHEDVRDILFKEDSYIYILGNGLYFPKKDDVYIINKYVSSDNRAYKKGKSMYSKITFSSLNLGEIYSMDIKTDKDVKEFIEWFKGNEFYDFVKESLE